MYLITSFISCLTWLWNRTASHMLLRTSLVSLVLGFLSPNRRCLGSGPSKPDDLEYLGRVCAGECVPAPETDTGQRKAGGSHVVNVSASGWQVSSQTAWSWREIPSILFFLFLSWYFQGDCPPIMNAILETGFFFLVLPFKITCVVDHLL